MLKSSFRAGLAGFRARPGLAVLIYLLNLALAALIAVPIATTLSDAVATTGFDADLASGFDLVLITDIVNAYPSLFSVPVSLLLWALPLVLVWKAALGVGLIDALRDGGVRPFWSGVGRYFSRAVLLSLLFLVPVSVWLGLTYVLSKILPVLFPGEVGTVWSMFVIVPVFAFKGLAWIDMMHDYARMALVIDEKPVTEAFMAGVRFPLRHWTAGFLYTLWFIPAALLWIAPTLLEIALGAGLLVFLVQQLLLLGRSAVTVGWFGSETDLYQRLSPVREPIPDPLPAAGSNLDPVLA